MKVAATIYNIRPRIKQMRKTIFDLNIINIHLVYAA